MRRGGGSSREIVLKQLLPFVVGRGSDKVQRDEAREFDRAEFEWLLYSRVSVSDRSRESRTDVFAIAVYELS